MYAIIATGGKQYKVAEGDIIKVEKLGVDLSSLTFFRHTMILLSHCVAFSVLSWIQ